MTEAPSNRWPINQAALMWLRAAKASPDASVSYLAQLAALGTGEGARAACRARMSPSQPERHSLESAVEALLGQDATFATRWFLSNPNLPEEEQTRKLAQQLNQARNLQEATQAVVETAYDLMVAESEPSLA
jgi:hypothetical protein